MPGLDKYFKMSTEWSLGGNGINPLSVYAPTDICVCAHVWNEHKSGYGARTKERVDVCWKCFIEASRKVWNNPMVNAYEFLGKTCMRFELKAA